MFWGGRAALEKFGLAFLWLLFAAASLIPVFGAGIFAMRYRAWQAATGRVYETKAPFGDFMRDELRSLTGGRG